MRLPTLLVRQTLDIQRQSLVSFPSQTLLAPRWRTHTSHTQLASTHLPVLSMGSSTSFDIEVSIPDWHTVWPTRKC